MKTPWWRSGKALGVLAVAALVAGGAWVERAELLAWFYVRSLARSDEAGRARWVDRVSALGEPAVPRLLDCLADPDPMTCANAAAALSSLSAGWGADDARTDSLAARLAGEWERLSPSGRAAALGVATGWFCDRSTGPAQACARLIAAAATTGNDGGPEAQARALDLCAVLLQRPEGAGVAGQVRELVRAALGGPDAANRVRAVKLALRPGVDLLESVAALLGDPAAEVRQAALLAVGPAPQAVPDEGLLPYLHDPDPGVRRLCEATLAGRGLRPVHIKLGRLLTDPRPVTRAQVLDHLGAAPDLDPGVWLRRLSHDVSPAVRAAALRAMTEQGAGDLGDRLSDRIDQMARSDPSPTVCYLAQLYQKHSKTAYSLRTEP